MQQQRGRQVHKTSQYLSWKKVDLVAEIERLQRESSNAKQTVSTLQLDNASLRSEIAQLRDRVSKLSLEESTMVDDNKKVAFLTGLPSYQALMRVLGLVQQFIPDHFNRKLSNFQEFLLVLMKLRLNLCEQYLAYRFDIHQSTVCRIFYKWIIVLSKRLAALVFGLKGMCLGKQCLQLSESILLSVL